MARNMDGLPTNADGTHRWPVARIDELTTRLDILRGLNKGTKHDTTPEGLAEAEALSLACKGIGQINLTIARFYASRPANA